MHVNATACLCAGPKRPSSHELGFIVVVVMTATRSSIWAAWLPTTNSENISLQSIEAPAHRGRRCGRVRWTAKIKFLQLRELPTCCVYGKLVLQSDNFPFNQRHVNWFTTCPCTLQTSAVPYRFLRYGKRHTT